MLLSSKVIKQVGSEMEGWPVHARVHVTQQQEQQESQIAEGINEAAAVREQEAELILEKARAEAGQLLAETNERISNLEKEAYEKGFAQGNEAASQIQKKAEEEFWQSTRQILQQVNALHERIIKDTEVEILALSIDIAEKLVNRQLDIKPETIVDIARAACVQAKECEMVIIYVAPEQVDILKPRRDEFQAQLYRSKRLEFVADPSIKSGGCRIETEQGFIEATIETMLKQLNTIIMEKV